MSYVICEQQRRRSACASAQADQHLCCSLPRQNDTSSLYIRNFKIWAAGLCSWAGQFVSCLVRDARRHILSSRGSIIQIKHKSHQNRRYMHNLAGTLHWMEPKYILSNKDQYCCDIGTAHWKLVRFSCTMKIWKKIGQWKDSCNYPKILTVAFQRCRRNGAVWWRRSPTLVYSVFPDLSVWKNYLCFGTTEEYQ